MPLNLILNSPLLSFIAQRELGEQVHSEHYECMGFTTSELPLSKSVRSLYRSSRLKGKTSKPNRSSETDFWAILHAFQIRQSKNCS